MNGGCSVKKLTAIVIGYGNRGATYAGYAVKHPEELEIVAVADQIGRAHV